MIFNELLRGALSKFIKKNGRQILTTYIQVPLGIIILLLFSYFIDLGVSKFPFTFPASVVMMLVTFLGMMTIHQFSPQRLSKGFHWLFRPSADWVLSNMGLFFTSSFILIPKRDSMSASEIGLICALFLPSFLATWIGTVSICKLLQIFHPYREDDPSTENQSENSSFESRGTSSQDGGSPVDPRHEIRFTNMAATRSKLSHSDPTRYPLPTLCRTGSDLELGQDNTMSTDAQMKESDVDFNKNNDQKDSILRSTRGLATSKPETKEDLLVNWMISLFDPIIYLIIFIIGIPIFFSPGGSNRALPLFLSTVVLSWIFSRRVVPKTWQMILHPILVTSAISVLVIFIFGSIKGMGIREVLGHYSTGSTYLVLFRKDKGYNGQPPECGDVMSSILNAGIICLAFPLFRYRQDLHCNFFRILIVIIPNCVISLFLWPFLANKMGMSGDHSITFAGRFMSTPFGIEFIKATGGDQSLVVVLICFTGIISVIIRDHFFRLLRVRVKVGSDDYFTIGMTTGVIAAAIGTSGLIGNKYHRAAATSTVSFVLYGIILLSLVAVPDISKFVDKLAAF